MITPEEESRWLAIERAWYEHRRRTTSVGDQRFYAPFREFFLLHFDDRRNSEAIRSVGNAIFLAVDGDGVFGYREIVRAALADLRYVEILLSDAPGKDDIRKSEAKVAAAARHVAFEIGLLGDLLEESLSTGKKRR